MYKTRFKDRTMRDKLQHSKIKYQIVINFKILSFLLSALFYCFAVYDCSTTSWKEWTM